MSNEEDEKDLELKDLIVQVLEVNGVLPKMKAQIRANVFMALEENPKHNPTYDNQINYVNTLLSSKNGQLTASLVREFMETSNLNYTLAVFDPEFNAKVHLDGRDGLLSSLELNESASDMKYPVLYYLLNNQIQSSKTVDEPQSELSKDQIEQIKFDFGLLDKEEDGVLNTEKVVSLMNNLFPAFNKNVFKAFVQSERELESQRYINGIDLTSCILLCQKWHESCLAAIKNQNTKYNQKEIKSQAAKKNDSKIENNSNRKSDDDNYDEDFTSGTTPRTPRTPRQDKKFGKNRGVIASDEEIEENISYIEESSKIDEVTNDKSISTIQGNEADYIEDVSI